MGQFRTRSRPGRTCRILAGESKGGGSPFSIKAIPTTGVARVRSTLAIDFRRSLLQWVYLHRKHSECRAIAALAVVTVRAIPNLK